MSQLSTLRGLLNELGRQRRAMDVDDHDGRRAAGAEIKSVKKSLAAAELQAAEDSFRSSLLDLKVPQCSLPVNLTLWLHSLFTFARPEFPKQPPTVRTIELKRTENVVDVYVDPRSVDVQIVASKIKAFTQLVFENGSEFGCLKAIGLPMCRVCVQRGISKTKTSDLKSKTDRVRVYCGDSQRLPRDAREITPTDESERSRMLLEYESALRTKPFFSGFLATEKDYEIANEIGTVVATKYPRVHRALTALSRRS